MEQAGVDALWVSGPANVRAVSGFSSGADGKVLGAFFILTLPDAFP